MLLYKFYVKILIYMAIIDSFNSLELTNRTAFRFLKSVQN